MERKKSAAKRSFLIVCLVSIITFSFAFREDLFQVSKNLEIFSSVYKELSINYVDDINSSGLMKTSIDAMLDNLDPYTSYVPESEIEDYKMQFVNTQYGGVGTSIFIRDKKIIISEVYEGFPAQKADIRPGDELVQVNNVSMKGKSSDEVSQILKGPKNTELKMVINRPGEAKPLEKAILREEIHQPNVSYSGMLPGNIGYIKLDKFLENSAQEVKDALVAIQKNSPQAIILDLRNNGGGILQESVKIVNLFVNKDVLVVTQKGRNREKTVNYKTFASPVEANLPLAVLVNNRSASASEIVAGSLQDLDRAVIIGQRSFGKGLVQQTFNLPYNSLVKVTVAKYYTPSGRCIQALDYTHRTNEGNVEKVADSLITEYKTKGGRSVYDGSGIYPDVFVKYDRVSPITQTLVNKFYIFDYATKFRNSNASIPDAKSFKLSDAQYADFLTYLSDKDYNYNTVTERLLTQLKTEAEKDKKMAEIKPEYDALKSKVSFSKKNDLTQFKDEISRILSSEIASRYYFQNGRAENNFKTDQEVLAATKVFDNKTSLASILKGEGTYKTIGKPGETFTANGSSATTN